MVAPPDPAAAPHDHTENRMILHAIQAGPKDDGAPAPAPAGQGMGSVRAALDA